MRNGGTGRPLNSVVRHHVNDIANIVAELDAFTDADDARQLERLQSLIKTLPTDAVEPDVVAGLLRIFERFPEADGYGIFWTILSKTRPLFSRALRWRLKTCARTMVSAESFATACCPGRLVVVGYTPRGTTRHIFSMRKANDREKARLAPYFEIRPRQS